MLSNPSILSAEFSSAASDAGQLVGQQQQFQSQLRE